MSDDVARILLSLTQYGGVVRRVVIIDMADLVHDIVADAEPESPGDLWSLLNPRDDGDEDGDGDDQEGE